MNKKKQIEEMEKIINDNAYSESALQVALKLYNAGYRKLSKEAQEMVKNALIYSRAKELSTEEVRKETAKEIYKELHKQFCGADGQYRQIIYDCGEGERLEDIDNLIDWKKYGVEIEQ